MRSNSEAHPGEPHPALWLDHFVVAIDDLETGIGAFEDLTGVRPAYGGEHPTLGTHNALVSLGSDQYLEILAPRSGATVDPMFRDADQHATLTPILWALATDDIDRLYRATTTEGVVANAPTPGSRLTESGDTLRWSMFMTCDENLANAPFFIEWNATTDPPVPGRAATGHAATSSPAGCSLESYAVESPNHQRISRWLAALGFAAPAGPGPARIVIALQTPKGIVTLGD